MSKIVIINMGGHGHVNPTLALTEELVARGHDVHYAVTEAFRDAIEATGAKFKGYESLWAQQEPPTKATLKGLLENLPVRFMKEALNIIPQLIDWVRELKPDVILYDSMCITGRLIGEALHIPVISLHASYAANETFSLGKEFPISTPPENVMVEYATLMDELTETYSVAPFSTAQIFGHSDPLNIVFMPREFQIAGETFDDRFVFCGPNIAPRPTAGSWVPPAGPRQKRLFISLGTVFSHWPEFFNLCFEAFGETEWQVFMSTSTRLDTTTLGQAPKNFTVAAHFPQLELLPHMDVFVMHGGMNSTMEALYFAVPTVVLPQMPEQAATARRMQSLGLGVSFFDSSVTAAQLREAVELVDRNAAMKENITAMQKAVRTAGGFRLAADTVEKFLRDQMTSARSEVLDGHELVDVSADDVRLTHGDTRI